MKKKLIFEDKLHQDNILSYGVKSLKDLAKKVREDFNKLGIGELDNETYQGIVSGGYSYIENKMLRDIDASLAKANMTLPSIKKMAVEDAYRSLNDSKIQNSIDKIIGGFTYSLSFLYPDVYLRGDMLTLQDGEFILDSDKKDEIFEQYTRIYIESEEDQKLWDSLDSLAKAINTQNSIFTQLGAALILPSGALANLFISDEQGVLSVKPSVLKHIRSFAQAKATKDRIEQQRIDREARETANREQREREYYGQTVKEWANEKKPLHNQNDLTVRGVKPAPTFVDNDIIT